MNRDEKPLDEKELEGTETQEAADAPTIEYPEKEGLPKRGEDPNAFTASVTLEAGLIESKSFQEVISILDYQLQAIRNLAIKKVTELKN